MPPIAIGDRFSADHTLSTEEIATFARLSGDFNPLHHDAAVARQSRFGGIIACGPHLTSLMMGMTATYFTQYGPALGLDFTFRFHRAVWAGEPFHITWEIVGLEPKASLNGIIVSMEGALTSADGTIMVSGHGKDLVADHL